MATMETTSLATTSMVAAQNSGLSTGSIPSNAFDASAGTSVLARTGHILVFLLTAIPGVLFWLVTFVTITLPTWLFTLFSMSLTFTLNFTTL